VPNHLGLPLQKGIDQLSSAFAAFPDTSDQSIGTQVHSFRIRSEIVKRLNNIDEDDAILQSADGFLCGYSTFIQQRDKSSKRGYSQVRYPDMAMFINSISASLLAFLGLSLPASTSGPLLGCSRDCKWLFHQTRRRDARNCMSRHLKLVGLCIKFKC
jgi:hypothetical protein